MSGAWFSGFSHWTPQDIEAEVIAARNEFRARRLGEPVDRYLAAYDASLPHAEVLIGDLQSALAGGAAGGELLKRLWATEAGRTAFRYLGAPPISEDDLETLAEAKFSPAAVGDDDGRLERLLAVMRAIIDPKRFPWIAEGREPTREEGAAAVLASTVLTAS